jgi:hypothetical protein
MTCDKCGGPTKPLFTGNYCVNECDLRPKATKPGSDCCHKCQLPGLRIAKSIVNWVEVAMYLCNRCSVSWNVTKQVDPNYMLNSYTWVN